MDPPTPEELNKNLAMMEMKKINAANLDEHYSGGEIKDPQIVSGMPNFPTYGKQFEKTAGPDKKDE